MMRVLVIVCLALSLTISASFAAPTSATIPLNNWVYPALEKLSGLGLIQSGLRADRPYTRREAARQTMEAMQNSRKRSTSPLINQLLSRLKAELHPQLAEMGGLEVTSHFPTYIKPLGDWSANYIYSDGLPSTIPSNKIDSTQFLLNHNNFGIEYGQKSNAQIIAEAEARFGDFFLINLRPMIQVKKAPQDDGTDTSLRLLQGTTAFGFGSFELAFGRQSLWWGQGQHGALALTNNAKPLDMIRITNPSPILLPWIFKWLGPFRVDYFLSQLEKDRVVPEPYFTGLNFGFKPLPWLELGMRQMIIFGGDGIPSLSFSDYIRMLLGDHPSNDQSNSIAVVDARVKIPALWNLELYGEIGAEDSSNPPFGLSDEAYLIGLYLPQIDPSERLSFRFEYADFTESDDEILRWYVHRIFRSGYTYEEKILGHFAGTDARDTYVEVSAILPRDLLLKAGYTYQPRGISEPVQENHTMLSLDVEWQFWKSFQLQLSYTYDDVENFDFVSGADEEFHLAQLAVSGRW